MVLETKVRLTSGAVVWLKALERDVDIIHVRYQASNEDDCPTPACGMFVDPEIAFDFDFLFENLLMQGGEEEALIHLLQTMPSEAEEDA